MGQGLHCIYNLGLLNKYGPMTPPLYRKVNFFWNGPYFDNCKLDDTGWIFVQPHIRRPGGLEVRAFRKLMGLGNAWVRILLVTNFWLQLNTWRVHYDIPCISSH